MINIYFFDQPYFHYRSNHLSLTPKQGRRFKERLGTKRDRLEYFAVFWYLLEYCFDSTFGVL